VCALDDRICLRISRRDHFSFDSVIIDTHITEILPNELATMVKGNKPRWMCLSWAALLLFEVADIPGATLVSQSGSKLVPLLNKILTLVSYSLQSLMLLKCMTIKQTMGLGCS
jgi:hypothetical protein